MMGAATPQAFLAAIEVLKRTKAYREGQRFETGQLPNLVDPLLLGTLCATRVSGHVVYLYERSARTLTRVSLEDGQEEDFRFDVWSELVTMAESSFKVVILFDSPLSGPEKGQIYFGLVAMVEKGCLSQSPLAIFDLNK